MKASLKATCTGADWTDRLPWVMLGLRTVPKLDMESSSAELVYGQALSVPGQFVMSNTGPSNYSAELQRVRQQVGSLWPVASTSHGQRAGQVNSDLFQVPFVFVRRGPQRGPLQPPYDGPYKVLGRGDKVFRLQVGLKEDLYTIDRLKPAYLEGIGQDMVSRPLGHSRPAKLQADRPLPTIPERCTTPPDLVGGRVKSTRSGREVRLPAKLRE